MRWKVLIQVGGTFFWLFMDSSVFDLCVLVSDFSYDCVVISRYGKGSKYNYDIDVLYEDPS